MRFGKIEHGALHFAPEKLKDTRGRTVFTNDPLLLRAFGYKPILFAEPPACAEGEQPFCLWQEGEEHISQLWQVRKTPDALSEALAILEGSDPNG